MSTYAKDTSVSTDKSRAEIESTLRRYGADTFGYMTEGRRSVIAFRMKTRQFRFVLELPDPKAMVFTHHSRGLRTQEAADKAWEQACRQKWRALALVIKAKLEAVSAGISTIEDEFLAHTLLPDRTTVGQWAGEELKRVYELGHMPTSLMLTDERGRP